MAEKDETQVSEAEKAAFIDLVGSFPVVGSSAAFLLKLSKSGRRNALGLFILLIAYPVCASLIVLFALRMSPYPIQDRARTFVLASLGVDAKVAKEIGANNRFIDFSRTLLFTASQSDRQLPHFQDVKVGQTVEMRHSSRVNGLLSDAQECAIRTQFNVGRYGTLFVRIPEYGVEETRSILSDSGSLKVLGNEFWDTALEGQPNLKRDDTNVTLEWSFQPSPELKALNLGECFDVITAVSITVYKPSGLEGV